MSFPAEFPVFETPRLRLRAQSLADAPGLFSVFGDGATMRYWSRLPMQTVEEAAARIERVSKGFAAGDSISWVVIQREDDRLVGTLDLFRFDFSHRRCECGYSLASTAWGKGYMSEVLPVALDYGFGELGLHRIEADTDPRNAASVKLLERMGFQREGTLRERWQVGGEVSDSAIFGLLSWEWLARRAKAKEEG